MSIYITTLYIDGSSTVQSSPDELAAATTINAMVLGEVFGVANIRSIEVELANCSRKEVWNINWVNDNPVVIPKV